jgi:hypothetical protein
VFLVAVPIAALAFVAAWLIPQAELKRWPEAGQSAAMQATQAAEARHAGPAPAAESIPAQASNPQ